MKPIQSVNIRPEVNILSVLRHLNYQPWFALAEFVDNSIQSYFSNRDKLIKENGEDFSLIVRINIEPEGFGRILISDNASGIALADFPRAFRPAQVPPNRDGLSEFGMGMKSAACWFARNWNVRTKAIDDPTERTVHFDIERIVEGQIEELVIEELPTPAERHYTVLELTHLCHLPKSRTLGKIKEHLASIYRIFLRDGTLKLFFNGELLSYEDITVLNAPYFKKPNSEPVLWRKDISINLGDGQSVKGFAALREIGSTTHAGFALFRRNRLIEGSADETYRPEEIFGKTNSYSYQRLFGELHLQGFDVSHTKDGFRWEEHEETFLNLLKIELQKEPLNLLDQAEGYRAKQHRKTLETTVRKATENVALTVERNLPPVLKAQEINPAHPPATPDKIETASTSGFERIINVPTGNNDWQLTIRGGTDPTIQDWIRIGDATTVLLHGGMLRNLEIDISLVHPFVERFAGPNNENIELLIRIASAIALASALGKEVGAKSNYILYHLNTVLRDTFSKP